MTPRMMPFPPFPTVNAQIGSGRVLVEERAHHRQFNTSGWDAPHLSIVCTFAQSKLARGAIGSLRVAIEEHGRLRYAGAVGTGFSDAVAFELKTALDTVKIDRPALTTPRIKGAVGVRPGLRVEVAYRGWTAGGELRHASFREIIK
jgi:hypothetical protein